MSYSTVNNANNTNNGNTAVGSAINGSMNGHMVGPMNGSLGGGSLGGGSLGGGSLGGGSIGGSIGGSMNGSMNGQEAPKSNFVPSIWGPSYPMAGPGGNTKGTRFSDPAIHERFSSSINDRVNSIKRGGDYNPMDTPRSFNSGTPTRMPRIEQLNMSTPPLANQQQYANSLSLSSSVMSTNCPPSLQNSSFARDDSQLDSTNSSLENEDVVSDLKLQVEALITAITLYSNGDKQALKSVIQGAEGLEVANRIMNRLKALRQENVYLASLANGSNGAKMEATNASLKLENEELKKRISELTR